MKSGIIWCREYDEILYSYILTLVAYLVSQCSLLFMEQASSYCSVTTCKATIKVYNRSCTQCSHRQFIPITLLQLQRNTDKTSITGVSNPITLALYQCFCTHLLYQEHNSYSIVAPQQSQATPHLDQITVTVHITTTDSKATHLAGILMMKE